MTLLLIFAQLNCQQLGKKKRILDNDSSNKSNNDDDDEISAI